MPTITAQEWELLTFFAVEPELQDDTPWEYNDALYTVRQGKLTLTFAIAPSYCDVRIILSDGDSCIYELNAQGVHDVRYVEESGVETLHIVIDNHDSVIMTLRLRPHILIEQGVRRY